MISNRKRILVTGASGFIGSHLLTVLSKMDDGHEIHALSRSAPICSEANHRIIWHQADLLVDASPSEVLEHVKPTHLIHGAWVTDHGAFWEHKDNAAWLAASLKLADAFARYGGERFINLGSVAEYDWSRGRMVEEVTPEEPTSVYGKAKLAFHQALTEHHQKGNFSAATGRIFYVYGPREKPQRLVPTACRALITEKPEAFGPGGLWRDYIHVSDLVRGIKTLLDSDLTGAVNIASGTPIRLSFLFDELEKLSQKPGFLRQKPTLNLGNEVPTLFADVSRLGALGWRPIVSFEEGLNHALQWWRAQLTEQSAS